MERAETGELTVSLRESAPGDATPGPRGSGTDASPAAGGDMGASRTSLLSASPAAGGDMGASRTSLLSAALGSLGSALAAGTPKGESPTDIEMGTSTSICMKDAPEATKSVTRLSAATQASETSTDYHSSRPSEDDTSGGRTASFSASGSTRGVEWTSRLSEVDELNDARGSLLSQVPELTPEESPVRSTVRTMKPLEIEDPKAKKRTSMAAMVRSSRISIAHAPVSTVRTIKEKAASEDGAKKNFLTVFQAGIVLFCSAMGGGIVLVPGYATKAGYVGFPIALVFVAVMATVVESAIFAAARANNAICLGDLCRHLPKFLIHITSLSQILWSLGCTALFNKIIVESVIRVIYSEEPDSPEKYYKMYLPVWVGLGIGSFFTNMPTNFGSPIAKLLFSDLNSLLTGLVVVGLLTKIIMGLIYGVQNKKEVDMFGSGGLVGMVECAVLLGGLMIQTMPLPQLNVEIEPSAREKGGFQVASSVSTAQGSILLAIGLLGYLAVGDIGETDILETFEKDWIQTALNYILIGMFFVSIPLVALPSKLEIWDFIRPQSADGEKIQLGDAPQKIQLLLNVSVLLLTSIVPLLMQCEVQVAKGRGNELENRGFQVIFQILSGTAANWLGLCLPFLIIVTLQVLPARRAGQPWMMQAASAAMIGVMAVVGLAISGRKIASMFAASTTAA